MPEIVKCPECKRTLRVPDDLLGKVVRCPSCQVTFTAQTCDPEPPPPPMPKMEIDDEEQAVTRKPQRREREDDEEERPARRRRYDDDDLPQHEDDIGEDDEMEEVAERRGRRVPRGTSAEWRRVKSGIGYLLAAVYTLIGVFVVYCCGIAMVLFGAGAAGAAGGGGGGPGGGKAAVAALGGMVIVAVIALVGLLAALVLHLIGLIMCLAAPEYRGGRMLAKVTLGLFITYLAAQVLNWILAFVNPAVGFAGANPMAGMAGATGLSMAVSVVGALSSFGYYGTMIFMLRSLAFALREEGLARNAMYFFIYYVAFVVFAIIAIVVFFVAMAKEMGNIAPGQAPPQGFAQSLGLGILAFSCILIVLSLGMLIWYIITLVMTRSAITRAVRR